MGNLNNFKRPPHKILINYKVKKSNSMMKNSGRHYLNQMIKANTTSNRANKNLGQPDRMQ